jgi:uncharacterized ferritin-like protein (DUF455 family)
MAGVSLLERILDDEIKHVRVGANHFVALCERRKEAPDELWKSLVKQHFPGTVKPPFNDSARESAGLPRTYYATLA